MTPGRSIAVDRLHEYGTPFFIEANLPIGSAKPVSSFHRLMIAQDTGSAIVGPARADLYLGAGDDAARIAGRIRHSGRFVMLLPRELDMIEAGKNMPLPVPRPNVAELAGVNKQEQGKVFGAYEDWRRQVWTPAPRDCAAGSNIDCGRGRKGASQEQRQQQQVAIERRGAQQKQQLPAPMSQGPQHKQPPHAMQRRGEQKQPPRATESRGG